MKLREIIVAHPYLIEAEDAHSRTIDAINRISASLSPEEKLRKLIDASHDVSNAFAYLYFEDGNYIPVSVALASAIRDLYGVLVPNIITKEKFLSIFDNSHNFKKAISNPEFDKHVSYYKSTPVYSFSTLKRNTKMGVKEHKISVNAVNTKKFSEFVVLKMIALTEQAKDKTAEEKFNDIINAAKKNVDLPIVVGHIRDKSISAAHCKAFVQLYELTVPHFLSKANFLAIFDDPKRFVGLLTNPSFKNAVEFFKQHSPKSDQDQKQKKQVQEPKFSEPKVEPEKQQYTQTQQKTSVEGPAVQIEPTKIFHHRANPKRGKIHFQTHQSKDEILDREDKTGFKQFMAPPDEKGFQQFKMPARDDKFEPLKFRRE